MIRARRTYSSSLAGAGVTSETGGDWGGRRANEGRLLAAGGPVGGGAVGGRDSAVVTLGVVVVVSTGVTSRSGRKGDTVGRTADCPPPRKPRSIVTYSKFLTVLGGVSHEKKRLQVHSNYLKSRKWAA